MAEFWSNNDRGYRLNLSVSQSSSSQVRVRLTLHNSYTTFAQYNCSAYAIVGGRRLDWSGRPDMLSQNSSLLLIDETVSVSGRSVSLSASFSGSGGWSPGTLSISGNSFTMSGSSGSSSSSGDVLHSGYYSNEPLGNTIDHHEGTIGSVMSITINSNRHYYTHTLRYSWASKSGTIATGVGTSFDWTVPVDFANDIPNATRGTGIIYVDTYVGNIKMGTKQASFSVSIPETARPSFAGITLSDTNGVARGLLTGNNFLQIVSNIAVTFNGASGVYGSSIKGYKAEIVNRNQVTNSNGGTLGMMNFNGSATIRASVVDSRGRQSEPKDVTINVIEYFAPILSFTAVRTRESPHIIQIIRNARVAPITLSGRQKNTMTLSFKVAPLGSNNYTTDNGSASGNFTTIHQLTNSAANMAGNYPANKSFTIIGTLADKFTRTEFSAVIATEKVVMSYDKDGRVGVGKVAELGKAGSLDVAGDIYSGGHAIQIHPLTSGAPDTGRIKWDNKTNVDDIHDSGFYWVNQGTPTGSWGTLEVYRVSNFEMVQFFTSNDSGKSFARVRHFQTGVWAAWKTRGIDQFYPVGSIYLSTNNTNPSTFMGGTWVSHSNNNGIYYFKRTA